jgi:dipeptidyl aminopeptidase/acylaminoacyl peptidase
MTDLQPELDGITTPAAPSVSRDGARVVFGVTRIDVGEDRYERSIWLADRDGAGRFTSGPGDSMPCFSPDGRWIAFLRAEDKSPSQLAVIPTDGGEATLVTEFDCGIVGAPVWSPGGAMLAVAGSEYAEGWSDLDEEERGRRPRRIRTRAYRADNRGWIHDRRQHIYLVDRSGEDEPRRLTSSAPQESEPAFSPDGRRVAFLAETVPNPGFDPRMSVWEADVETGEAIQVAPLGMWTKLSYRPDGALFAIGSPGEDFPELPMLWRLGAEPELCNRGSDRAVHSFAAGPPQVAWQGDAALVTIVDSGTVTLGRVEADGSVNTLGSDRAVVTGFDAAAGTTAYTVSRVDDPGRLVIIRGEEVHEHSDFGGADVETTTPHHLQVEGPGAVLDCWVYLPEGEDKVPLLLNIHGGPASQYGWGFFDEFQVYVSGGYGVVAANPRGSAGRDREFLRAVSGEGWGTVDTQDIDAVVEAALDAFPRLDPERMGVMGGSYGGFLTAWLIAHQSRWKRAVVERALLSWPSFAGTSDIGGWFSTKYLDAPELEWDRSPLRLAANITTPTLILHSENDFRCPIEQAEQLYNSLVGNGVETEFVRFPGEGHELSRSGSPRHREERFRIILEWLAEL